MRSPEGIVMLYISARAALMSLLVMVADDTRIYCQIMRDACRALSLSLFILSGMRMMADALVYLSRLSERRRFRARPFRYFSMLTRRQAHD